MIFLLSFGFPQYNSVFLLFKVHFMRPDGELLSVFLDQLNMLDHIHFTNAMLFLL